MVKNLPANVGDVGLIPGSGRSLEKGMAPHSSILAWRIQWTGEPGGLQSLGRKQLDTTEQLMPYGKRDFANVIKVPNWLVLK